MNPFDVSVACRSCGQDLADFPECPRCKIEPNDPADAWDDQMDVAMLERMKDLSVTSRLDLEAARHEADLARRRAAEEANNPKKAPPEPLPPGAGIPDENPRGHGLRLGPNRGEAARAFAREADAIRAAQQDSSG